MRLFLVKVRASHALHSRTFHALRRSARLD